ncbi:uncharacterized protein [Clytia hemisphaerica]|uniref:Activin types I and II receptor domain-containing protein n=1 Tax=Clytia hemisphaerica TaxID=252671 RepID=A0A7M5X0W0_9CNID
MKRLFFISGFITLVLILELGFVLGSDRCFQCHSEVSQCRHHNEVCQNNSSCFIKSYVPVNKTEMVYHTGCVEKSECEHMCQQNAASNSTVVMASCKVSCCNEDFCNNIDDYINSATSQQIDTMLASFFVVMTTVKMVF